MERLGYYAKDFKGTLYQYEWGVDDTFYIIDKDGKRIANVENYEILEIGFFKSE